jgi:hypothetical protein
MTRDEAEGSSHVIERYVCSNRLYGQRPIGAAHSLAVQCSNAHVPFDAHSCARIVVLHPECIIGAIPISGRAPPSNVLSRRETIVCRLRRRQQLTSLAHPP